MLVKQARWQVNANQAMGKNVDVGLVDFTLQSSISIHITREKKQHSTPTEPD